MLAPYFRARSLFYYPESADIGDAEAVGEDGEDLIYIMMREITGRNGFEV